VGIVDEAVEDGVGVGGIADEFVPLVDRQLAGDEDGAAAIAGFEDFEKIVAGGGIERGRAIRLPYTQVRNGARAAYIDRTNIPLGECCRIVVQLSGPFRCVAVACTDREGVSRHLTP
jgi:hypothetical protein